jgi:FlaA1/EpsC-like NDP-sugar epimerase
MLPIRPRWKTLAVQLTAAAVGLAVAWLLRFEFSFPYPRLVLISLPLLVGCRWISLSLFRLTRQYWRYTGIGDLRDLVNATITGSIMFFFLSRSASLNRPFPHSLPLSIFVLEALVTFLLLSGLRVSAALILQAQTGNSDGDRWPVLVIGAGSAGAMLLKSLRNTKYVPVGLLDDDPALQSIKIYGVPVLGAIDTLPRIVRQHDVKEVLIATPSATGAQMLRIADFCTQAGVAFRAVPNLSDLIDGKVTISELRELNLDDLLGRKPVTLESDGVLSRLQGRSIMITGAAGSIGSELCKQIIRCGPVKLVCVDHAETPLFNLEQQLLPNPGTNVVFAVTDITDGVRMRQLLLHHQISAIFHAAAYKHVPLLEANPYEGFKNNVFGLLDLVELAEDTGCKDFLLISSDKAVKPSSLMGCTKRLGELIVGSRTRREMRCVCVRFGNVLGSQGSVIPLFRSQIREGRSVTVTHPEATRYFMTIPEAVSLTLQAFTIGDHGDILVLDMGHPILILDLARTLIRISGRTERDIPIVFTGLRPGEKLHEELFYDSEIRTPTSVVKVTRAKGSKLGWRDLQRGLKDLNAAMRSQDSYWIRAKVKEIIPEYQWLPSKQAKLDECSVAGSDNTPAWVIQGNQATASLPTTLQ